MTVSQQQHKKHSPRTKAITGINVYFSSTGLQWTLMPEGPPGYSGPLDGMEFDDLEEVSGSGGNSWHLYTPEGYVVYYYYNGDNTWQLIFADEINVYRGSVTVAGSSGNPPEGTISFEGGCATIDVMVDSHLRKSSDLNSKKVESEKPGASKKA